MDVEANNSGNYVMDWEIEETPTTESAILRFNSDDRIRHWKAQLEEQLKQDESLTVQDLKIRPLGHGFCLEGVIITSNTRQHVLDLIEQLTEMERCVNRIHVRTLISDQELD